MDAGVIVQIFLFLGLIAGFWRQWKSEGRQQEWTVARDELIAKKAAADAKVVADKAVSEAAALALKTSKAILP